MGCGMSKQESGRETLESNTRPIIRVYGPTDLGQRGDDVVFEEDSWREYYNRQALRKRERYGI